MKLGRIFGLLILVVILGLFFAWLKLPDLIAMGLSNRMQVAVQVQDVDLSSKAITVKNLVIDNPKNATLQKAFSAGSITVNCPISNYMSDPLVIEKVEISTIYLGLEFMGATALSTNWTTILNNLHGHTNAKKEKGRKVIIKKLILNDISSEMLVNATLRKAQGFPHIERLEFNDLSSDEGLAALILNQAVQAVFSNQGLANPQTTFDKLLAPFKPK